MVDGFFCLRHDSVIGRDHKDNDIRQICPSGSQLGESFMTGCVDEGDRSVVVCNSVCTNVLGNATMFFSDNVGFPYRIQESCFAVIDMSQDRYDGRSGYQFFFLLFACFQAGNIFPFRLFPPRLRGTT